MEEIFAYQKVSPDNFGAGSTTPPRKRTSPRILSINFGSDPRQPSSRDHGIDRPPNKQTASNPDVEALRHACFVARDLQTWSTAPVDGATRFDSATSNGHVSCSAMKTAYGPTDNSAPHRPGPDDDNGENIRKVQRARISLSGVPNPGFRQLR